MTRVFAGSEESLAHKLAGGPMPLRLALEYALQIVELLRKAHQNGRGYGALSVETVHLTANGVTLVPATLGFGPVQPWVDVSAFGAVLCEMLGRKPRVSEFPAQRPRQLRLRDPGQVRAAALRLAERCMYVTAADAPELRKIAFEIRLLIVIDGSASGPTDLESRKGSSPADRESLPKKNPPANVLPEAKPATKKAASEHRVLCPKCGSSNVRVSQSRNPVEWMLSRSGAPYCRCRSCYHRFSYLFVQRKK